MSRSKRAAPRRRAFVWLGITSTILALAFITAATWLPWLGEWLAIAPNPQHADAIVVLGGGPERADHAAALYTRGLSGEVWITGDDPVSTASSNTRRLAERAVAGGVPAQEIHLLVTTSTWEDGREIARFARERKLDSILVVTDWYHSRRAICVIHQQLGDAEVRVFYDPPPDPIYGPRNWWAYSYRRDAVLGEYFKLALYIVRYHLNLSSC